MSLWRDFTGKSGAVYRFMTPDRLDVLPGGGNVMYVQRTQDDFRVLYLGQAETLAGEAMARWGEAVDRHGATHLLVRLNVSGRIRLAEHADMVDAYDPPMNRVGEG